MTKIKGLEDTEREELTGVTKDIFSRYGVTYTDQIVRCDCETHGVSWIAKSETGQTDETTDDYRYALAHLIETRGRDWSREQEIVPLVIGICSGSEVYQNIPSIIAERTARQLKRETEKAIAESEGAERLAELRDAGETAYRCSECEGVFSDDELLIVRECPVEFCGTEFFDGTDGRNCEDCNRPFTRKTHERGCPDCEPSEEQVEEVSA